jgi:type I restriction enzyme S subunit
MTSFEMVPLTELADIHDHLREPVSQTERNKREGKYPYFGATGQVGWIDDYKQDGRYVLLGEDGAPFLDSCRPKAYVVEGKCWVNNHAHVLKGKEGICDDEYLCFALNWADYSNAVTGSTRLKLPQGTMNRLLIPRLPIAEQRQTAARLKAQLAEVETARQAAQAQVKEAEALRASVYREAFRSVVPITMPPEFDDAPNGWQWRRLTDIARLESGHTPSRLRPDWWDGDVSWISLTEIRALDVSGLKAHN